MTSANRKDDAGKLRLSKLPWDALGQVAKVLEFGSRKYGWDAWRGVPNGVERYVDAALRHLSAFASGEMLDPESGLPHLAHASCSSPRPLHHAGEAVSRGFQPAPGGNHREKLLALLSDLRWHRHRELAAVAGVRYSARLLELRRLGYVIEDSSLDEGKAYRLTSNKPGAPKAKLVKVYLREQDARSFVTGQPTTEGRAAVAIALDSFNANREKL